MDPQELEQLRQKLQELNQSFDSLGTNVNKASLGVEDILGKKLSTQGKALTEVFKGLGRSVASYNDAMIRGERGAKTAANSMGELADGIQTALNVLAMFAPGGFIVKGLLVGTGMVVKGLSEYGKAATQQADILFKSYKDLAKISAAGAGLDETFRNLQQIGLTATEIERFTTALKNTGSDLLYFGSSMADGAREFSNVVGGIYKGPFGRDLEMLGLEFEDLASSTATYVTLQGRLGRLQLKTQEDLMRETYNYTRELDILARMTGQSRAEQEKTQRSLLEDERWTGFLEQAKASGQDLTELQNYLGTLPAELRRGLQHIIAGGGAISSEEARKTIQTLPEAFQIAQDVMNQNVTAGQAYERTFAAIDRFSRQTAGSRAVGATEGFGLTLGGQGGLYERTQMLENIKARVAEGQTLDQAIRAEQERARVADDAKKTLIDTDRAQRNYQQNLDAFTNKGLRAATAAAEKFAQALERGSRALPGSPVGGRATTGGRGGGATTGGNFGTSGATTGLAGIRNMIAGVESGGDYNIMQGGGRQPLTAMTVADVLNLQQSLIAQGKNTAAGKYQIINKTLMGLVSELGIDPNTTKFDQATQDRLADVLIKRRGYSDYASGKMSKEQFLQNLSMEWAGLPSGPSGQSYYAGVAGNRAHIGWEQAMQSFSGGGIATGPTRGYPSILHGIEAVVPLPDGKTIPVSMNMDSMVERLENAINRSSMSASNADTTALMAQQIGRLDEMINQMRNQVSISQKLLQYTR